MAATFISLDAYSDALVVLGTAGIVVPLVRRFGLSPVLGYLGAGAVLGPLGLGSFMDKAPWLYWVTVVDAKNVSGFAELGIVFLLFLIGLELSYQRLVTMRRLVFGLGSLQVVLSHGRDRAAVAMSGRQQPAAAVDHRLLPGPVVDRHRHRGALQPAPPVHGGRPHQLLDPAGAGHRRGADPAVRLHPRQQRGQLGASTGVVLALANAALAIGLIVVVGRLLLRPLLRLVASTESSELFVAAILFVIVGSAVAAGLAGLSMALGAFVAGLLLAETEFRKAIETTIEPFKGLLLGLFFFTVGMNIDFRELAREPLWLFASRGRPHRRQGRADRRAGAAVSRAAGQRRSRPACCWAPAASSPSSSSAWRPATTW